MKSKKVFWFIVTSLCLSIQGMPAVTGNLVGRIIDEDNFSLPGANVVIEQLNTGAATDQNGDFRLTNLPVGEYNAKVMFIGYLDQEKTIRIEAERTTTLNITMASGILELDEVTVVGDRLKGQAKALNQQRTNFNITNIVSSDQMGRFPDQNIGDALKRIPGFSVNYDQGEARYANVRGTAPELNAVMINGERVPSAEGEARAVQLDLIPTEMIQTIEVNKVVTPDMDADAIGGAVNLVTRQAPNSRRLSATLGSGYNFLSEKPMLNGSFIAGQRFFDDKLGLVVSGTWQDHRLGSDNAEGSWDVAENGGYFTDGWEVRQYEIRRLRRSVSTAFDYQFNANNQLFFDAIYNHRNDWENRFRLEYGLSEPNADGISEESEIIRQVKAGSKDDDNARLEDQRTTSLSLKGDHFFANLLDVKWSLSYAKASEERPHERYIEWALEEVPVGVNLSDPRFPLMSENYAYDQFELGEISEEFQYTDEIDTKAKIDFSLPLATTGVYADRLSFGLKYKAKDKKRDNSWYEVEAVGADTSFYQNMAAAPLVDKSKDNFLAGDYKVGQFTDSEFIGNRNYDDASNYEKKADPSEYAAASYTATEDIIAAYIMLDQHLGAKLKMKVGVRVENTTLNNAGNQYDENTEAVTPTSGDDSYTNILPGLYFKYDMDENTIFRFAYTNTLARPRYYDLVPYREIAEDNEELAVGNPALKPTLSTNLDFMAEHYLTSIGLLAGGVFYKNITDFIYVYGQDDYVDPMSGNTYDEFFQPRNGAKATLYGIEAAFQRQLTFLPGVLSNFGVYLNYTYTYSKTDNPEFGDNQIKLPGAAPHSLNANLTYQMNKLSMGLSFNYTSPYLDPDDVDLTPGLERYYDKVTYLDFNSTYKLTEQVRFYLEANNLLNQPLRYYAGVSERTFQQEYYSSRITAGFKYDF